MHRILKPTGSIFLHCDWHADAYIRVNILDRIFGENNFRGDIVWQRHNSHNDAKKKLAVLKDTICYYSKSKKCIYNPIYSSLSEKYIDDFYKHDEGDGKGLYSLDNMASLNLRPNMMYEWQGFPYPAKGWRYEKETMQKLHDEGKIYYPTTAQGNSDYSKRPRLKRYLNEQKGQLLGDVWTDIQNVQSQSKERIGYPTQKPEALLQRIIEMASNESDVILDRLCWRRNNRCRCRQTKPQMDWNRPERAGNQSDGTAIGQTARPVQRTVYRAVAQIRLRHITL